MNQKKISRNMLIFFTILMSLAVTMTNLGNYQLSAIPSRYYEAFSLTDAQFSSLMTGPMVPPIFFAIILGVLVDKLGISKIVNICFFLTLGGYVLRFFATSYSMMLVSMILTGFAATVLTGNLSKIVACVYPPEQLGLMVGIFMAISTGCCAISYSTTAYIPTLKLVTLVGAAPTIICTILWTLFIREDLFRGNDTAADVEAASIPEALRASLKSVNLWFVGLSLAFFMGGSTIVTNFVVATLTTLRGYSESYAGSFPSVLMIGSLFGSILIPMAAERFGKHMPLFFLGSGILIAICTMGFLSLPAAGIYVCAFLCGFFRGGAFSIAFAIPVLFREIGPRFAGTAGGFILMIDLLGAVVLPTYVVVPLAGPGNYTMYFIMSAVCGILAGIFMYLPLKRSRVYG